MRRRLRELGGRRLGRGPRRAREDRALGHLLHGRAGVGRRVRERRDQRRELLPRGVVARVRIGVAGSPRTRRRGSPVPPAAGVTSLIQSGLRSISSDTGTLTTTDGARKPMGESPSLESGSRRTSSCRATHPSNNPRGRRRSAASRREQRPVDPHTIHVRQVGEDVVNQDAVRE